MRRTFVPIILLIGSLLTTLASACGGDGGSTPAATDTPAAQAPTQPTVGGTPVEDPTAAAAAFEGVPLPEGVTLTEALTVPGADLPLIAPSDTGIEPDQFATLTMRSYDVALPLQELLQFYQANRGDWDESFADSTEVSAMLIWTRDGGNRILWVILGDDAPDSSLTLVAGVKQ